MRGEDNENPRQASPQFGSPPHARGRPGFEIRDTIAWRITPACAGKTASRKHSHHHISDHPRMRGEDANPSWTIGKRSGSPPHARGRHFHIEADVADARITPACAGKTHLRLYPMTNSEGSPPHARGRLPRVSCSRVGVRITPACAGKTVGRRRGNRPSPDHPRMRGEDLPTPNLHKY